MVHLTDTELQQYANGEALPPATLQHLQQCPHCSREASIYKSMAATLTVLEVPSLNAALVEKILQQTAEKPVALPSLRRWALASIILISLALLPTLFLGGGALLYWSVGLASIAIGVFEVLDMWQQHQRTEQQLFKNA